MHNVANTVVNSKYLYSTGATSTETVTEVISNLTDANYSSISDAVRVA